MEKYSTRGGVHANVYIQCLQLCKSYNYYMILKKLAILKNGIEIEGQKSTQMAIASQNRDSKCFRIYFHFVITFGHHISNLFAYFFDL